MKLSASTLALLAVAAGSAAAAPAGSRPSCAELCARLREGPIRDEGDTMCRDTYSTRRPIPLFATTCVESYHPGAESACDIICSGAATADTPQLEERCHALRFNPTLVSLREKLCRTYGNMNPRPMLMDTCRESFVRGAETQCRALLAESRVIDVQLRAQMELELAAAAAVGDGGAPLPGDVAEPQVDDGATTAGLDGGAGDAGMGSLEAAVRAELAAAEAAASHAGDATPHLRHGAVEGEGEGEAGAVA